MMVHKVKDTIGNTLDSLANYLSEHPIFGGLSLMIAYFMFDYEFMIDVGASLAEDYVVLFSIFAGFFAYYITYFRRRLKKDLSSKDRKIEIGYFIGLIIVSLAIFFSYDTLIVRYLPSMANKFHKSEVVIFLVLAPIFEELAFRYLLYDKWAKIKYGKIIGGILIGFIFIIAHPITDFVGFTVYWLPTLFLFMTYDLGGVKASITAHLLFNIVALL